MSTSAPAPSPTPPPAPSLRAAIDGGLGPVHDPWTKITTLTWGADRSFLWAVRQEVLNSTPTARPKLEERLLKALAQAGHPAAHLAICDLLALIGSAASVPALSALLRRADSTEVARFALEAIPGPESAAALRDALPHLAGRAKAGLIGSLAARGDTASRALLLPLREAAAEPPIVRDAAARAAEHLGRLSS
jgi:hypothetical protein